MSDSNLIDLTADIVSAHVSNNSTSTADLPGLIQSVFAALSATVNPVAPEPKKQEPAVSVRQSIKHDYIVCLEDGTKLKMLKRYLRTNYDMSPEEYRAKWGLQRDYPMVAPAYAEQRRELAVKIGLGRKAADQLLSEPSAVIPKGRKAAKNVSDDLASAREHLTGGEDSKRGRGRPKKAKEQAPEQSED